MIKKKKEKEKKWIICFKKLDTRYKNEFRERIKILIKKNEKKIVKENIWKKKRFG